MVQSDDQIRNRAAALAEEVASGLQQRRAPEWLEEVLGSALLDVANQERERCALVVDQRVEMWEASARGIESGTWPTGTVAETRARLNEARAIADALRVSITPPRGG